MYLQCRCLVLSRKYIFCTSSCGICRFILNKRPNLNHFSLISEKLLQTVWFRCPQDILLISYKFIARNLISVVCYQTSYIIPSPPHTYCMSTHTHTHALHRPLSKNKVPFTHENLGVKRGW